ncbi:hypothetical protein [Pseudonocardia nigra]|uniref:hypothetical protein n=1 Tax=Pseudonocardia nigra TaxID=1921578 RepID=UPI001C5E8B52|nr:hypothetical protein [Pseudonocardia nigra]
MTESTSGRVAYLDDHRPCGECGHSTGEHWTEATASFACARPGCGCTSWWSMDITAEDIDDEDATEVLPWATDRPGWVGPPVVTLCGSMRFWPLMVQVAAAETAAGAIVLAPFVIVPPDEQNTECGDAAGRALKVRLDALHRAKIAMSSSVLVVTDRTGYWGESTRGEIGYALGLGVPVRVREVDRVTGVQTTHGPLSGSWGWSR